MSDCHPTSSVSAMFSYLKLRYKREVIMFYKIICAHHTMDLPDYILVNTRPTRGNDLNLFSHLSTLMLTNSVSYPICIIHLWSILL